MVPGSSESDLQEETEVSSVHFGRRVAGAEGMNGGPFGAEERSSHLERRVSGPARYGYSARYVVTGSVTYRSLFYDSARVLPIIGRGRFWAVWVRNVMEVPVTCLKSAIFGFDLHKSALLLCRAI